jgi:hypothetical protein
MLHGMSAFKPSLHIRRQADRVCLTLAGVARASGPSLEEAADELVRKVLLAAMALRSGSIRPAGPELRLDPGVHEFIWELGAVAARGDDIRPRLFGESPDRS